MHNQSTFICNSFGHWLLANQSVFYTAIFDHVRNNNLDELFQSAYKAGHTTETALLRVQNDVLRAIDNGDCVMLLLLDLPAAFDTVDHSILLSRLSNSFGIAGAVYQWLQSYLSGRTQFVAVGNARSSCRPLTCGLPQGSVLGPNCCT